MVLDLEFVTFYKVLSLLFTYKHIPTPVISSLIWDIINGLYNHYNCIVFFH